MCKDSLPSPRKWPNAQVSFSLELLTSQNQQFAEELIESAGLYVDCMYVVLKSRVIKECTALAKPLIPYITLINLRVLWAAVFLKRKTCWQVSLVSFFCTVI